MVVCARYVDRLQGKQQLSVSRGKAGANGAGAKRLQIAEESDRHLQKEGATA